MEPSEVLGRFTRPVRFAAGMTVYALAGSLVGRTEAEIAAFGLVIAATSSGWMSAEEIGYSSTSADLERLAAELLERIRDGGLWHDELGGGG